MDTKVGKREKKEESSAWTLCSGLPSRRKGTMKSTKSTKGIIIEPLMDTNIIYS